VCLAVSDVQVAARNFQGIVPSFGIQVNADHLDIARRRQVQMESEPLHERAALAVFELNVEEQPATVDEFHLWARQFVEASLDRRGLWDSVVRPLHPSVVKLAGEILSKLSPEVVRL
jgi:hypothetical protein